MALVAAAGTVVLGIPLGLLARQAGDDMIALSPNQTPARRTKMDFKLRAEPGQDGSFIGFWLVCYLVHSLFPSGSLLAAMIAWKGRAALSRARCAAAGGTFLALFCNLFAPRVLYVRYQLHYVEMLDIHMCVYGTWAIGAFLIIGVPGGRCVAAMLIVVFAACYYACTELIWRIAAAEPSFTTVVMASFANHVLRIIMVEVAMFVAVRLPNATQGAVTTLVALAVALSVAVGHALAFCAHSMPLLLLTQLIHFSMEVSRSFYLLKGKSEGDRLVDALRAVYSAVSRCCSLACCCWQRRPAVTPVLPTTEALELPSGEESTRARSPSPAQQLRRQALADVISLTNVAETATLLALTCLLPLARVRLGKVEAGHMLPLHEFILTVLACEMLTDFTIAVWSSKWSRSSGGVYSYQSTVQVWQGLFSSTRTQVCVMIVVALAALDTACNLIESMCILQEDDSGTATLGPCGKMSIFAV